MKPLMLRSITLVVAWISFTAAADEARPWPTAEWATATPESQQVDRSVLDELDRDEQRQLIQAFATVEAHRQVELSGEALLECGASVPIEGVLQARLALLGVYNNYDLLAEENSAVAFGEAMLAPVVEGAAADDSDKLDRVIDECGGGTDEERDACFDAEADKSRLIYPRKDMAQAFGDVSFSLAVDEIGIASYDKSKSKYGWHIIKRLK